MKRKKIIKLKEITFNKKWLKTNILRSVELDYPWTVTPLFDGHHSTHAFQQKALSGLPRVQEP
jgi:hypothetical protein